MSVPVIGGVVTVGLVFHYIFEFLKATFFVGIVFIPVLGFWLRKPRFSVPWIVSSLVLAGLLVLYGRLLINLPIKAQTRGIVSEGGALVAEGRYDEAIEEYRKLEALGKTEDMQSYLQNAYREKEAAANLEQARQLAEAGRNEEALEWLARIPGNTRAAGEADALRKSLSKE
jgi:tetratricopeptide (TPR) repeat protein